LPAACLPLACLLACYGLLIAGCLHLLACVLVACCSASRWLLAPCSQHRLCCTPHMFILYARHTLPSREPLNCTLSPTATRLVVASILTFYYPRSSHLSIADSPAGPLGARPRWIHRHTC
jgi:hypothetical protein